MKKICVFGASGKTGIKFVRLALDNNYQVTSVVRSEKSAEKLPPESSIMIGNSFDENFIQECVKKHDIVVSLIGHVKNSDPRIQTKVIKNIIKIMERNNISRLISLTGTGVRKIGDKIPLYDKIANFIIRKIDPERILDGIEHVYAIENSNLNWTILRVLKLTESKLPEKFLGEYKLKESGPAKILTPRTIVAKKILEIIESDKWVKKCPVI